jgi:hypothetical protein
MTAGLEPGGYNSTRPTPGHEYPTRALRICQRGEGGRTCVSQRRRHACSAAAVPTFWKLDPRVECLRAYRIYYREPGSPLVDSVMRISALMRRW